MSETIHPTAAAQPTTPPIVEIFQLAYKIASAALVATWTATTYLLSGLRLASVPFTSLFAVLYAPVSYILAPVFLAAHIITNILVIAPYTMLEDTLSALYPIYAFIVVSAIFAAAIGLCARGVSHLGMNALSEPQGDVTSGKRIGDPSLPKEHSSHPKRVTIKDEFS
jgi:hypothetical protein